MGKNGFICRMALLLCVLTVFACIGCTVPTPAEPAMTFEELLVETNIRRTSFASQTPPDPSGFTPSLYGRENLISEEEMDLLTTPTRYAKTVTAEQARQDVDVAFRLLKHSYSLYDFFGGDKVFYEARKKAMDALPEEGDVTPERLEEIFVEVLDPILMDRHFRIEGRVLPTCKAIKCWYVPDLYFNDVTAVEDTVSQYVRLTVDEAGCLRYCLVAYVNAEQARNLPDRAKIGERTVHLRWKQDTNVTVLTSDAFVETTLGEGIPYLVVTTMDGTTKEEKKQLQLFEESGKTYADAPLLVVDLRENPGGYNLYGSNWLCNLNGNSVAKPYTWLQKNSKLNLYAIRRAGEEGLLKEEDVPGTWTAKRYKGRFRSRVGITFFVTDRNTASAAEVLLLSSMTIKNTLIVGGDTAGCCLGGNNHYFYLPDSGLEFRLAMTMFLFGDLGNFDGVGIRSDVWTPAKDAAKAVNRLIEYYGLTE